MNLKESLKALNKVYTECEDGELCGILSDVLAVYHENGELEDEDDDSSSDQDA